MHGSARRPPDPPGDGDWPELGLIALIASSLLVVVLAVAVTRVLLGLVT